MTVVSLLDTWDIGFFVDGSLFYPWTLDHHTCCFVTRSNKHLLHSKGKCTNVPLTLSTVILNSLTNEQGIYNYISTSRQMCTRRSISEYSIDTILPCVSDTVKWWTHCPSQCTMRTFSRHSFHGQSHGEMNRVTCSESASEKGLTIAIRNFLQNEKWNKIKHLHICWQASEWRKVLFLFRGNLSSATI